MSEKKILLSLLLTNSQYLAAIRESNKETLNFVGTIKNINTSTSQATNINTSYTQSISNLSNQTKSYNAVVNESTNVLKSQKTELQANSNAIKTENENHSITISLLKQEREEINNNINALKLQKKATKGYSDEQILARKAIQDNINGLANQRQKLNEQIATNNAFRIQIKETTNDINQQTRALKEKADAEKLANQGTRSGINPSRKAELESELKQIKDNYESQKLLYKSISDGKTRLSKVEFDEVKTSLQTVANKEKALILENASLTKKEIQDIANQKLKDNLNISSLEKRIIQENAQAEKKEIQDIANLEMKNIQNRVDANFKLLNQNKPGSQSSQLNAEVQAIQAKINGLQQVNRELEKNLKAESDLLKSIKSNTEAELKRKDSIQGSSKLISEQIMKNKVLMDSLNNNKLSVQGKTEYPFQQNSMKPLNVDRYIAEKNAIEQANKAYQEKIRLENQSKEAVKQHIKEIDNKTLALRLDLKDISKTIAALEQLKQQTKGNSQETLKHKETIQQEINTLKNRKTEIDFNVNSLIREKAAIQDKTLVTTINTKAMLDNVAGLSKQRESLSNTKSFGEISQSIQGITSSLNMMFAALKQMSTDNEFVNTSSKYEVHLRNFNSLAQETEGQLKLTHEALKGMANKDQLSGMTELAKSLQHIESSGFHAADAFTILEDSNRTAKSGLADLFKVVDAGTSILKAYQIEASGIKDVNNINAKVVQYGKVTYDQLNSVIGTAISLAPEAKVAYKEVAAAIATITVQGVKADIAVTEVNALIKGIFKPSVGGLELAKSLDIDLSASALAAKGLGGMVDEIMSKTAKFGNDQGTVVAKLLGDIREIKGLLKLSTGDMALYNEMLGHMGDNTDQVSIALKEQTKTFQHQKDALGVVTESLKTEFGFILQNVMAPFLWALNNLIDLFMSLPEPIKLIIESLILLGGGIVTTTIAIGSLALGFTGLLAVIKSAGMVVGIETIILGLKGIASAITSIKIASAVGMFGLIGATLAALTLIVWTGVEAWNAYHAESNAQESWKTLNASIKAASDNVERLRDLQRKAKEEGKDLTNEQKTELSHSLAEVSLAVKPGDRQKVMADAIALGNEVRNQIEKTADVEKKSFDEHQENEALTKKGIENLANYEKAIFEASHSERENRIKSAQDEFDNIEKELNAVINSKSPRPEDRNRSIISLSELRSANNDKINKINQEEDEKDRTKSTQLIDKYYDAILSRHKKALNDAQAQADKDGVDKVTKLKIVNDKLLDLQKDYLEKSKKFKVGSVENESALEEESKIKELIEANKLKITQEKKKAEKKVKDTYKKDVDNLFSGNIKTAETNIKGIEADETNYDQESQRRYAINIQREYLKNLYNQKKEYFEKGSAERAENEGRANQQQKEINKNNSDTFKEFYDGELKKAKKFTEDQKQIESESVIESLYNLNKGLEGEKAVYEKMSKDKVFSLKERKELALKAEEIETEIKNNNKKSYAQFEKDKKKAEKESLQEYKNNHKERIKAQKDLLDKEIEVGENNYNEGKDTVDKDISLNEFLLNTKQISSDKYNKKFLENIDTQIFAEKLRITDLNDKDEQYFNKKRESENKIHQLGLDRKTKEFEIIEQLKQKDRDYFQSKIDLYTGYLSVVDQLSSLSSSSNSTVANIGGIASNLSSAGQSLNNGSSAIKGYQNTRDDSIEQLRKQIPNSSPLSNKALLENNSNNPLAIAAKQANGLEAVTGAQMAIGELSKSLDNYIQFAIKSENATNKFNRTVEVFGKGSSEAANANKELAESFSDYLKALPGIGEALSKVGRLLTDFLHITTSESEKKNIKDIQDSIYNLEQTRLSLANQTKDKLIEIAESEYNQSIRLLTEKGLAEEAYRNEKEVLELNLSNKLLKIQQDAANKSFDIAQNLQIALMGTTKDSYDNKVEQLNIQLRKKYTDIANKYNPNDEEGYMPSQDHLDEQLSAYQEFLNAKDYLDIDAGKKELSVNVAYQESIFNLEEDGYDKEYKLLEISKENKLALLDQEVREGLIIGEQAERSRQTILNEFNKKVNDLQKKSNEDAKKINSKNYDDELSLIKNTLGKKRKELESDYDKQLDIIAKYEDKKKALKEKRDLDSKQVKTNDNTLKSDIAKLGTLDSSFFENNQAQNDQNLTENVNNINNDVDLSFEQKNAKLRALFAKDVVYYQAELKKFANGSQASRIAISERIQQTKNKFNETLDPESQAMDSELQIAKNKRDILLVELVKAREAEEAQIKLLDIAYKTSADTFRTELVKATDYFVSYTKKEISAIGSDLFNQIRSAMVDMANRKKEYEKLVNPSQAPADITNSNQPAVQNNNTNQTTAKDYSHEDVPGFIGPKTPDFIRNKNKTDINNVSNSFDIPSPSGKSLGNINIPIPIPGFDGINIPIPTDNTGENKFNGLAGVSAENIPDSVEDPDRRQRILDGIYAKLGAFDYQKNRTKAMNDLIKYAQDYNIPTFASGGVTRGASIAGEAGTESIYTYADTKRMYDYIKKITEPGSMGNVNNSQSILFTGNIIIQGNVDSSIDLQRSVMNGFEQMARNNQYNRKR